MSDLVKIQIPFSGFYNSIHGGEGGNIDTAMESCFNYDYASGMEKEIPAEVYDAMYSADVDWNAIHNEYCQNYTEAFGQRFGLTLTFDEMTSPREYNFSTDKIYCEIPRKQIDKIRKAVEAHKDYPRTIDYRFTSRSGFWSNYSNDYKNEEWTRETLDECQYEVIIQFWLDNIELADSSEGWNMEEWYITNDFEMCNWDSVINAQKAIEAYLIEEYDDFAHCQTCDIVINLDKNEGKVVNDYTYCLGCANKDQLELIKEKSNV